MNIKFKRLSEFAVIPTRADSSSAGWDLACPSDISYSIEPGQRVLIKLGFAAQMEIPVRPANKSLYTENWATDNFSGYLPDGFQVEIRPRSGNALKKGLTVLNSPGTIDSNYTNEWGVILFNSSQETIKIEGGDRIAQAVLMPYWNQNWYEVEELNETDRKGGFGSSGN